MADFLAVSLRYGGRQFIRLEGRAFPFKLTVHLQVAYITTGATCLVFPGMDMIQVLRIGEIAVKCKIARDTLVAYPIYQLAK